MLQATGSHAWAVSGGWVAAGRALHVLGTAFRPRARWGAEDVDDDDGLADFLACAGPDRVLLLLGFDWHSQMLHRSERWRSLWRGTRARRVLYVQESISNAGRLTGTNAMAQAFQSAASLCDGIVFTDVADRPLIEAAGRPSLWQPFGADANLFRPVVPYEERVAGAFFRGKTEAFAHDAEYSDRRRILDHLLRRDLVTFIPYAPKPVKPSALARDFNRYQLAVNLPSVFGSHPTRVLEGLACGCCVLTNRTGVPALDALFREGVELVYYRDELDLAEAIARLRRDPAQGRVIAASGRSAVLERFALPRLLQQILAWSDDLARR
ncbi:glycosyltransferase family protein [Anaeromyxobacter oryzisoli]|uniref:glycosyltransferase family protein n=1 Tax=Anaeromyxobacter oryzisoli TaxID=2925408 RepID=UPI001F58FEB8|nr:glycosyltransferase [Anaeromyxobacter sp. SG63]